MSKMMVQWASEDSNMEHHGDELTWGYFYIGYMIESIISKFKHPDLAQTECLRFIDPEFSCIFNRDQAITLEKEITELLTLELTPEERVDCENMQGYIALLPADNRKYMYLRFCSIEYTKFYVEEEYWHRDKINMNSFKPEAK